MEQTSGANQETISRFDQASQIYQTGSIKYRKLSADRVLQLAQPGCGDVILDIGCGPGIQLIECSGTIKRGIGIDISPGMVQEAARRQQRAGCGNLEFHVGDFLTPEREISLRKSGINKVISNYALHHLKLADKKRALTGILALLGTDLEMVVIGDLMFFEEPTDYAGQYGEIGYGPGTDQPCYAGELAGLFDNRLFDVTLDRIHPLVGVLRAVRKGA